MRHSEAGTRDGLARNDVPQIAAALLERLRARSPRVHCITNAVAQNFTANVLLASGAVPSMTLSVEEIGAFVAGADALLVNLGTFDRERREAAEIAVKIAVQENVPWVLDPVFIDRTPPRAAFARALIERAPSAVRLNAAEFAALSGSEPTRGALAAYARATKTAIGLSGEIRLGKRRRTLCGNRQWPCFDGQSHRHGLRRLGAGRGLSRRRTGRLARHRRRADDHRRRRRIGGGQGGRPRQLRGRHPRYAP